MGSGVQCQQAAGHSLKGKRSEVLVGCGHLCSSTPEHLSNEAIVQPVKSDMMDRVEL